MDLLLVTLAAAFVLAVVSIFDVSALVESATALVASGSAVWLIDPPVPVGEAVVMVPACAFLAGAVLAVVTRVSAPIMATLNPRLRSR